MRGETYGHFEMGLLFQSYEFISTCGWSAT